MFRLTALSLILGPLLLSCAGSEPNRDPTGERFPPVRGTALDETEWSLPGDLAGEAAVILVGYIQDAHSVGALNRMLAVLPEGGCVGSGGS